MSKKNVQTSGVKTGVLFAVLLILVGALLPMADAFAALGASVTLNSGQPTTIYPGQTTELKITLSNSDSTAPVTGVAFSDSLPGTLPDGLKVAGSWTYTCTDPATSTTSDPGTETVSAAIGSQSISLSNGAIPAHANSADGYCTLIIPVTAGTSTGSAATYTYTIASGAVTGTGSSGSVANSGTVSQSINASAMTKPTISKSFGSSTLYLGGNATTLTITLTNGNPVAIPNFSLSDVFPTSGGIGIIKVAATPNVSNTCGATFAPAAGDTSLSATGGTIPANGSCTLSVAVEANQTNGAYTVYGTNTINASSQFSNDLGIAAAANATAPIYVYSPLRISKAFAHASLSDGQSDNLVITLSNDGNSDLTVNSFTDDPIDGTTAGNSNTYGLKVNSVATTCSGGSPVATTNNTGVTLTGGTIPHNGSCTVTINFTAHVQTAGTPITYTNTIAQRAVNVGNAAIVSQYASASVLVADDLRVLKTATPSTVAPGNPVKYTITVQNFGASAIAGVTATDHLINGLTFLNGTINGIDYTPTLANDAPTLGCGGLNVTGATGSTAPAFTFNMPARVGINTPSGCLVTFYAMASTSATAGSSTANSISAGDVCYGTSPQHCNGNSVTSSGTSVSTTVLAASKYFDGATSRTYSEGTISTLKIVLTNYSANPLTNASISDTLPLASSGGQLRIASPANAASNCGSPTITATAGTTSVAMNGATVPARASNGTGSAGSCYLQVDVVGGAGIYNNTATADATETYADGTTHTVGTVSTNTATLTYTSALSATKSFNPTAVSSGGTSTVTIHLSNTGAVALTGVALTDPLPSGMVVAPTPNAYSTCAGSPVVTAAAGAGTVSLSGASIAGNSSCDLLFDVKVSGTANWVNTIPVGNITAAGGVANQTAVSGTLTYQPSTNITVANTTNPSTLTFPGQTSQLTITLTNGSQAVSHLRLTNYFTNDGSSAGTANGMVIASTPAASTTCPGGTVTAAAGGTSVGLSGASLAASASCTVTVNVTSTAVGGITDIIPIGAIADDQGLTNSGAATTSLTTQSNIGVTKQFTPNVVAPGVRSRLRITFYNPTTQPLTSLAATDTLPSGMTVPSGANPVTTCTGATVSSPSSNKVQVSGGSIAAASGSTAASCYVEIDVLAATQGDYVNTIPAGAVTGTVGGAAASNSQPASDTLRAKSSLTIHEAIDGKTLDSGNPVGFTTGTASTTPGTAKTLTIKLSNPNAADLTAAAFTDALPSGLVVATTPNASTTCGGSNVSVTATASGTSIALTGATIPAAGSCTVTVDVLSNVSGSYTDSIAAGAVTTYEGVSNAEPTSAEIVISTPPTVSKQFSPSVIPPNGTSILTIVLGNSNSSAATLSSVFTDTLPSAPGAMTIQSPNGLTTTCPGAVTATAGGSAISYASGASIPAGGCTISVNVTASASGDYTNNIPAGTLVTSLGSNQQPANAGLTVSTLGYVSGRVFEDNNVTPNGSYDSGTDTPMSGVSIELHSGPTCGGTLVSSTTTDTLGNYSFSGLAAGTYSVCEPVQPTGTTNGTTTAGTITSVNGSTGSAGTASNPTATTSQVVGIVLNGNGTSGGVSGTSGNNFAEIVPSSISGTVFVDQNDNGVQNGADTGISGITIQLLDSGNNVVASTTTDSSGNYAFTGLSPGTYSILEPSQPSGTANGITTPGSVANGGTAGIATGPTTVPSKIAGIVLPPNTTASGNNFAEIPNGRTLSGRVFLDYNNNGTLDGSDHGIGSQTIALSGTDINGNAVSASATTATDGSYSFTGLPPGTYTVSQASQPAGTTNGTTTRGSTGGVASNPTATTSQIAGIDLTGSNTVSADNNFAEQPGAAADLAIAKTHSPASFAEGGNTGYYTITPSNIGSVATSGTVTVVDNMPAGITPTSASGTGWSCLISSQTVTCTSDTAIAAGTSGDIITLHVTVASGLAGQILTNTATISGGGEPPGFDGNNTASDPTPISSSATVSGHVWRDLNHNQILDSGEPLMAGWTVQLLYAGTVVDSAVTDTSGTYHFTGVAPGTGYQIRFLDPTTGAIFGQAVTNEQGITPVANTRDSGASTVNAGTNTGNPAGGVETAGELQNLTLLAGDNIVQQSLPLDPAGVIYDSVTRNPVAGATITLSGPAGLTAADVVGGSLSQTTGSDGFYQFLLLSTAPAGTYTLTVTSYPAGYLPATSALIPACGTTVTVTATPSPAVVQTSSSAPAASVPNLSSASCPTTSSGLAAGAGTTQYFYSFDLTPGTSADVINNHIPLDPILGGAIVVTKTTPLVNVVKGDLVPYTITASNTLSATLTSIAVQDQVPPGFKYRSGSATLNGSHIEPTVSGRDLTWSNQSFNAGEKKTYKLVLTVGVGVSEGEYINKAWALNTLVDTAVSNVASATVRVVPDPTFDCSDIIGKVFDDRNANGYQDQGEPGIPNVRIATVRGLLVTTDAEGRFHVACADIPQQDIGSNFIMKLDPRTLPSGYRLTTENPRVVRTSRGKMVKLNFGATIHKVFRLEVDGRAFAEQGDALRPEWEGQLQSLVRQLRERPSTLRIAYRVAAGEPQAQAAHRLDDLAGRIKRLYDKHEEGAPPLIVETEIVPGKEVRK